MRHKCRCHCCCQHAMTDQHPSGGATQDWKLHTSILLDTRLRTHVRSRLSKTDEPQLNHSYRWRPCVNRVAHGGAGIITSRRRCPDTVLYPRTSLRSIHRICCSCSISPALYSSQWPWLLRLAEAAAATSSSSAVHWCDSTGFAEHTLGAIVNSEGTYPVNTTQSEQLRSL